MFFDFGQNNSYGYFVVDEKVCHRLFIEADNEDEAVSKAEGLGCYWDGVDNGKDCPCCGDRWSRYYLRPVPIEKYTEEGYSVGVYDGIYKDTVSEWNKRYGKYECVVKPEFITEFSVGEYVGKIRFKTIEEYAQFLADGYGWTVPDARIYYKDGTVKEIFAHNSRCDKK